MLIWIYFLIVNINVSVNNFSFKYICVVLYLELRFYCLTCSFTDFRDFNSENRNVGVFQNKTNIEITGFSVTHFGYTLDLSDTDLWNIDLLDTYLDLLDTDITSKHFVCLQDVLKTFTRYVFKTSSRRLEDQQMFAGQNPFSWLLVYHFTMLLESWMFI